MSNMTGSATATITEGSSPNDQSILTSFTSPPTDVPIQEATTERALYLPGALTLLSSSAVFVYLVVLIAARRALFRHYLPLLTSIVELLYGGLVGIPAAIQLLGATPTTCGTGIMAYNQSPSYFLQQYLFSLRLLLAAAMSIEKLLRLHFVLSANVLMTRCRLYLIAAATAFLVFLLKTLPDLVILSKGQGEASVACKHYRRGGPTHDLNSAGSLRDPPPCEIPLTCFILADGVINVEVAMMVSMVISLGIIVLSWSIIASAELIGVVFFMRQRDSARRMIRHQPAQIEARNRVVKTRAKYLCVNILVFTLTCLPQSILTVLEYANAHQVHTPHLPETLILYTAVTTFLSLLPGPWLNLLRFGSIRVAIRRSMVSVYTSQ